jgi:SpoVK/Ycf46/Vps4 family AAA+-type ATPase
MSVDPSVLAAIGASVEQDPDNLALRLHYASLLFDASEFEGSLKQLAVVLAKQPDNLEALKLASQAATSAGDNIRAAGYENLLRALSWNSAKNLIESSGTDEHSLGEIEQGEPERVPLDDRNEAPIEGFDPERPKVTLGDVAGLEDVKKRLELSFLGPLRNEEIRKLYGKSLKGGLLLYGPPGCGKTYIARALAGELGAHFLSIGLTDVVDMWLGQSEKNLHEVFQTARRQKPCVLFFDEIDALGQKRSLMRGHAGRNVVNQLLAELDGAKEDNEGLYVIAATNHPWDVDSALRRPGRFDRTVLVLPPDAPARAAIAQANLRDRPTKDIDYKWIGENTEEFSGADMTHLCESAAEFAMSDSIKSGVARPITTADLKAARKEVKPSTRSWMETARNHAVYANEGGLYDDLLEYLKKIRIL